MPPTFGRGWARSRISHSGGVVSATSSSVRSVKRRRDIEHESQMAFFLRIDALALNDKRYVTAARRTFAIPNGGRRSKAEAGRLKAEGVRAGVSDIFCSVARGGQHGLYIEMKSPTGRVSDKQLAWLNDSEAEGYRVATCRSADEAWTVWKAYVDG